MSGEESDGAEGASRRPTSAAPGPPAVPIPLEDEAMPPAAAAVESVHEAAEEGPAKREVATGKSTSKHNQQGPRCFSHSVLRVRFDLLDKQ